MPSTIGWLDQSEAQQRRMREVIALFAEGNTVDDIGIGVVRDAFSELLFPGLSTVQTRLRYFLLVPWVYQRLEEERVPSDRAEDRARQWEIALIGSLMSSGESEGVIGSSAGKSLKQLPSFTYWSGLRFTGILHFTGTRGDYHRAMNRINLSNTRAVKGESDDTIHREPTRWHHHLPPRPDDLWETASLSLTEEEAAYLQERFAQADQHSLFATLVRDPYAIDRSLRYPWDAVVPGQLPPITEQRVAYARWFSETIYGAQVLYNLMLAEAARERGLPNGEERYDQHHRSFDEWKGLIDARRGSIETIERGAFWQVVDGSRARVSGPAYRFINSWLDLVVGRVDVSGSTQARDMIRTRERQLKKGQARLQNARSLENWLGASGANRLNYRWIEGRAGINDIAAGLGRGDV